MQITPTTTSSLSESSSATSLNVAQTDEARLREKAKDLEAAFLAEMLKLAGVGKMQESFNGGAGEEQFSSFLADEYARSMVDKGGIGLAESIFQSLQKGAQNA
ncbi:rod-binding protein [Rhodobacter maris]|uniref:Rod binding protein n=1 Tax=Rhodobacter maris TaxID=446682 RepID=A0A285SFU8_9RHOB|nr:rod-binding protein [Rhodobacter maris]SOC06746.1 rod binding protein [Rhodobacter maris]